MARRRVLLPGSGRDAILSDTVGFVSDLPTQLVAAFQVCVRVLGGGRGMMSEGMS